MLDSPSALAVSDLDPFSRESLRETYRCTGEIREQAPVVFLRKYGVYATGRHKLAQSILMNWKLYSSTVKAFGPRPYINPILVAQDPPEHTHARGAMMKLLAPSALEKLRPDFETEAELLVDRLLSEDKVVNAHEHIGAAFVLKVLPDLLGVIPEGRENLLRFGDIAFNSTVPVNEIYQESLQRNGDAIPWLERQCERDAISPNGLAARIYELSDEGVLTVAESHALVQAMLAGGFDTTVMSIASGLYHLSRHPDQWDWIREDPESRVKIAYDEILRYEPPSRFLGRGVLADTEIEGVPLKAGDRIVCFLAAAGRDPRKWDAPDDFDVRRAGTGGISFGVGLHTCLGQAMARLEFSCLATVLARRVKRIEACGEGHRVINNQANGWEQVPVRLHAA